MAEGRLIACPVCRGLFELILFGEPLIQPEEIVSFDELCDPHERAFGARLRAVAEAVKGARK